MKEISDIISISNFSCCYC